MNEDPAAPSQAMLVLAVALGGATGAVCRYGVSLWLARVAGAGFPWGTLAVNAVGSLLLGLLLGFTDGDAVASGRSRALVGTGFCGGLTTFSTFSLETVRMPIGLALANTAGNLSLSLLCAALGLLAGRTLRRAVWGG